MLTRSMSPSRPPIDRLRRSIACSAGIVALALACMEAHADATRMPKELLFVGLMGSEWRLFVGDASASVRRIDTISEPRTPAYSTARQRIAYISSAGALQEIDLISGTDSTLLRPSPDGAFTQPTYRPGTDELYVVVLREGASVDTDIARLDRTAKKTIPVLRQRSAQFEPSFTRDGARMIYSNVLCAAECPTIIQEIWSMDIVGGRAEQLTLMNSVSRQAVADERHNVVFASNKTGHYQLWRVAVAGGTPHRLTAAPAVDESPVITDGGDIYFVRRDAQGVRLMRLDAAGIAERIALPAAMLDVRDLRWGR